MTKEFVYLRTGEKCRVIHEDENLLFVAVQITHEEICYNGDYEACEEDGRILKLLPGEYFASPPTKILSEEVVKLEGQIATLRAEKLDIGLAAGNAKKAYEQELEKYTELSSALVKLGEFLDGKITHYLVVPEYSKPEILTVEETTSSDTCWGKAKGRLLSLVPKKGRTVTWALNRHCDGSGSDTKCIPCTSYEEALLKGQQWIDKQVAKDGNKRQAIGFAQEHDGLKIPRDYILGLIQIERGDLERDEIANRDRQIDRRKNKEAEWAEMLRGGIK